MLLISKCIRRFLVLRMRVMNFLRKKPNLFDRPVENFYSDPGHCQEGGMKSNGKNQIKIPGFFRTQFKKPVPD